MASLSSEPLQWEWATRALAPTLPPPRPAACKGNTGRARVKGRVRDRAEQKPQPQDQEETRMDNRDEKGGGTTGGRGEEVQEGNEEEEGGQ